jgi:hypothetical protein
MSDVLRRLVFDVPYRTGPLAWSDLHAGGIFFCVVYRECLQFGPGGQVRRWCEVLDDSRPFDDEAEKLRATDELGSYHLNDRGYLECVFSDFSMTGLTCQQATELLAFCGFRARPGVSLSFVYARETLVS